MEMNRELEPLEQLEIIFKKVYSSVHDPFFTEFFQEALELITEEDLDNIEEYVYLKAKEGSPGEQRLALKLAVHSDKIPRNSKWKKVAESAFDSINWESIDAAYEYVCYFYEGAAEGEESSGIINYSIQLASNSDNEKLRLLIYRTLAEKFTAKDERLEFFAAKQLSKEKYPELRMAVLDLLYKHYTISSMSAIMKIFSYSQENLYERAEEMFDQLYARYPESQYLLISKSLSHREQRLFCHYLEQRSLQYVYQKLYSFLTGEQTGEDPEKNLSKYGRVCNWPNERMFLMHCYGREELVQSIFERVLLGDRSSLLLLGEHGVGKTAVINEVIRRLIDYSEKQKDESDRWLILETGTTNLMTETRYLGEWETKLTKLTAACRDCKANVLLYVTNINGFLGAGRHSSSDENFCDFFRPLLMRGEVMIIAESTPGELESGIARDVGFLRLFKEIRVSPMTSEETQSVVKEIIDKNTLRATLNKRFIGESLLTTGSAKKGKPRLFRYEATFDEIQRLETFSRGVGMMEALPGSVCSLLEHVAEHDLREIDKLPKEEKEALLLDEDGAPIIQLTTESITQTISEQTGFPLSIIDPSKRFDMEEAREWFSTRLIGQPEAVDEIITRLAMMKASMTSSQRPFAVYFLVGPTGVGKTYFAKLVAEYLFGSQSRMNRLDLSEYQGSHSLERLIGDPRSDGRRYSRANGSLTEKVRAQPFSVFLLDEFEKASHDIHNLFLQVFDEARITDQGGNLLNFSQSIILITSNVGCSRANTSSVGFKNGMENRSQLADKVKENMKKHFAPELLNRLDKVIFFNPLDEEAINKLIDFELSKLYERIGIRTNGISIFLGDDARKWLEKNGFSEDYGARHLLRAMEQSILSSVSRLIVQTEMPEDRSVHIGCRLSKDGKEEIYAEWKASPHISNSSDAVAKSNSGSTPSPVA